MFAVCYTPLHQAALSRSMSGTTIAGLRLRVHSPAIHFRASIKSADDATIGAQHQHTSITFRMPPLSTSLTRNCHPLYDQQREEVDAWLLSLFDPPLQGVRMDFLIATLLPLCGCVYFSHCHASRMLTLNKFNAYFFVADDTLEAVQSKPSTRHAARWFVESHLACMQGRPFVTEYEHQEIDPRLCKLVQGYKVLWEEVCAFAPRHMITKCADHLLDYLKGNAEVHKAQQAAINGSGDQVMTVERMLAYRILSTGTMAIFSYIEMGMACTGCRADPAVIHRLIHSNRRCKEIMLIGAQHGIQVNDLMSCKKDHLLGRKMNLISVLSGELAPQDRRLPEEHAAKRLQAAVDELWRMIQTSEHRLLEALDGLRMAPLEEFGGDEHVKMQVLRFAEAVECMAAGNLYWASQSARYHGSTPLSWDSPNLVVIPVTGDAQPMVNLDVTRRS